MLPAISAAIGILTMMSLVTFVAGSVPPSTPFAESTITVNEKEINCGGDRVRPALAVKDRAGNVVTQTTVGTQVLIEGTVDLDCNSSPGDPPVAIFEVRDAEGMTDYLAWQTISVESGEQITTGLSWMPERPGVYDVRFFPIVCLNCPMVLNKVVIYEITVV